MGTPALNNWSLSSDGPYQTFVSHLAVVLWSSCLQTFLPPIHLFMAAEFGFLKHRSNCCTFFLINLILWRVESRLLPVVKKALTIWLWLHLRPPGTSTFHGHCHTGCSQRGHAHSHLRAFAHAVPHAWPTSPTSATAHLLAMLQGWNGISPLKLELVAPSLVSSCSCLSIS